MPEQKVINQNVCIIYYFVIFEILIQAHLAEVGRHLVSGRGGVSLGAGDHLG